MVQVLRCRLPGAGGWEHAFGETRPQSVMTLSGAAFTVDGAPRPADRYVLGGSVAAALSEQVSLELTYAATIQGAMGHAGNARLSAKF